MSKRKQWNPPGPDKYNLGNEVKTIERLYEIAKNNKAVYVKNLRRHNPASVMLHMQCITILNWINKGWLIEIKNK